MTTARFTMRLDPELKLWLEQEAHRLDRSAGWLAKEAIAQMKHAADQRQTAIAVAIAKADQGVFVSQSAVHQWMQSWDTDDESTMPQPDVMLNPA